MKARSCPSVNSKDYPEAREPHVPASTWSHLGNPKLLSPSPFPLSSPPFFPPTPSFPLSLLPRPSPLPRSPALLKPSGTQVSNWASLSRAVPVSHTEGSPVRCLVRRESSSLFYLHSFPVRLYVFLDPVSCWEFIHLRVNELGRTPGIS